MAELSWSFSSSSCLIEVLTTLVPHPRPPKNITHMQQAASTRCNTVPLKMNTSAGLLSQVLGSRVSSSGGRGGGLV